MLKYSKITVCTTYVKGDILAASALYGALRHWGTILAYRMAGPVEDLKIWKGVNGLPKAEFGPEPII